MGGPLPIRVMDGCSVHIKCIEKWEKRHQCGAKATVSCQGGTHMYMYQYKCHYVGGWSHVQTFGSMKI